jgi:hypothetical protein
MRREEDGGGRREEKREHKRQSLVNENTLYLGTEIGVTAEQATPVSWERNDLTKRLRKTRASIKTE